MFNRHISGIALVTAAVLGLHLSSAAHAVVIDFDSLTNIGGAGGEIDGTEFTSSGIIFSTPHIELNVGASGISIPNSLGANLSGPNDFDGTVVFEFTGVQYSTDVTLFSVNSSLLTGKAFDVAGTLLDTQNVSSTVTPFDFTGFPVHKVEVSGDFFAIDDVSFTLVPEPTTLALAGLGLSFIAMRRKR